MTPSLSQTVSRWVAATRFEDVPADVVAATKLRVLDVIGLAVAGSRTPFGRSVCAAAAALHPATKRACWAPARRSA